MTGAFGGGGAGAPPSLEGVGRRSRGPLACSIGPMQDHYGATPVRRSAPTVALALLALAPAALAGQTSFHESPHDRLPEPGEDFCGQLFLEMDGRVFGHEFTHFFHDSTATAEPPESVGWYRPGSHGSIRVAAWWHVSPDSVGAWMEGEDDTIWRVRLGRNPDRGYLEGTVSQAVPERSPAAVARAALMRMQCGIDDGPGGGR